MNRLRLRARCSAQKTGAKERPARMVRNFLKDTSGATAIEYALIAAGISIVIVNAVNSLGIKVTGLFTKVDNGLN
jgi:pilus assembly protein Flp/PilA